MSKKRKPSSQARVQRDARGRAHLVIQRDGHGHPAGLALSGPLFNEAWQNDLAVATAGAAHRMLGEGHTHEQAAALGRDAMAATSTIADGLLARGRGALEAVRRVSKPVTLCLVRPGQMPRLTACRTHVGSREFCG